MLWTLLIALAAASPRGLPTAVGALQGTLRAAQVEDTPRPELDEAVGAVLEALRAARSPDAAVIEVALLELADAEARGLEVSGHREALLREALTAQQTGRLGPPSGPPFVASLLTLWMDAHRVEEAAELLRSLTAEALRDPELGAVAVRAVRELRGEDPEAGFALAEALCAQGLPLAGTTLLLDPPDASVEELQRELEALTEDAPLVALQRDLLHLRLAEGLLERGELSGALAHAAAGLSPEAAIPNRDPAHQTQFISVAERSLASAAWIPVDPEEIMGSVSDISVSDVQLAALGEALALPEGPWSAQTLLTAWLDLLGDPAWGPELTERLARRMQGAGAREPAAELYQMLQRRWPLAAQGPEAQRQLMFLNRDGPEALAMTMQEFVERYSPGGQWEAAHRTDPEALALARGYLSQVLFDVAVEQHGRAQRSGDAEGYARAAELYAAFLRAAPLSEDVDQASWYRADALFNSGQHREAIQLDEQLLAAGGHEYVDLALYQRFYAWYEVLDEEYGGAEALPEGAEVAQVVPLAEGSRTVYALGADHAAFIEAADAVRRATLTDPDVEEVREANITALHYVPAQILYEHKHFEEARERFWELIDLYPRSEDATRAAASIVNTYVEDGDLEGTVQVATRFRSMRIGPPGTWPPFEPPPGSLAESASFKLCLRQRHEGDLDGAVECWLHFMEGYPDSRDVPLALYNAANTYEDMGQVLRANELYEQYVQQYPRGEFAPDLFWRIATNEAAVLHLEAGILYYERLFGLYPDDPNAPSAIYNSAFLRLGLGDLEGAANSFGIYATQWPDQPDAERVYWLAGVYLRKVGDAEGARFCERYLARYGGQGFTQHELEALAWLSAYHRRRGESAQAAQRWKELHAVSAMAEDRGQPEMAEALLGRMSELESGLNDTPSKAALAPLREDATWLLTTPGVSCTDQQGARTLLGAATLRQATPEARGEGQALLRLVVEELDAQGAPCDSGPWQLRAEQALHAYAPEVYGMPKVESRASGLYAVVARVGGVEQR